MRCTTSRSTAGDREGGDGRSVRERTREGARPTSTWNAKKTRRRGNPRPYCISTPFNRTPDSRVTVPTTRASGMIAWMAATLFSGATKA